MSQLEMGRHRLRVTGSALVEKQGGGDPTVQVYVQDIEDMNQMGTVYLATSEAAWEWTEKKLKVLGWDPKENQYRLDYLNVEGESPLLNVEFDVDVCEGKPYTGNDGKERTGIQINFLGLGGFAERMEPKKAAAFSATLRARLLASQGQSAAPARKAAPKKPAPPADNSMSSPWDDDEGSRLGT